MDWRGVDFLLIIVMFLSAVWTLILTAPIHCRRSIVSNITFLQICSHEETNSSTSWMVWGWVNFKQIFNFVRWPRELNALQLQKTHANRKSTSKSRKHLHQFDSKCCKCSQHNQIKNFICSAFLCLVVLWAFAARVLSNWWSCLLNLQVFFLFAVRWALSATVFWVNCSFNVR